MSGTNPFISQGGPLNRLLASLTFGSFSNLNVTSSNMTKTFVKFTPEGPFVTQIETGVGVVNSPEPYVMATATFGILRTQTLASSWLAQVTSGSVLGAVNIIPDTTAYPTLSLANASVTMFDPSAFDGKDAAIAVTIRGVYYVNQSLWSFT